MPTLLWLGPFMALLPVHDRDDGGGAGDAVWKSGFLDAVGTVDGRIYRDPPVPGSLQRASRIRFTAAGKGAAGVCRGLPLQIWLAVIFAVGVFLMAISYRIVMRQQVAA